jgi:hypothetical protein
MRVSATEAARQDGAVLVLVMSLLLAMGLLATVSTETAILQLRMADNEQRRTTALQVALAVSDSIADQPEFMPLRGGVGHRICAVHLVGDCDDYLLQPDLSLVPATAVVEYHVSRVGPLLALPDRQGDAAPDSALAVGIARQEITVRYRESGSRQGKVTLVQGMLHRLPLVEPRITVVREGVP